MNKNSFTKLVINTVKYNFNLLSQNIRDILLILMGVAGGFFADSRLEISADENLKEGFILSIIEDLNRDVISIDSMLKLNDFIVNNTDTIIKLLEKQNRSKIEEHTLYLEILGRCLTSQIPSYTKRTIVQLENSGNLRLFNKMEVSNTIVDYYLNNDINSVSAHYEQYSERILDLFVMKFDSKYFRDRTYQIRVEKITDYRKLHLPSIFLDMNETDIKKLVNLIWFRTELIKKYIGYLKMQKNQAEKLITILKEHY